MARVYIGIGTNMGDKQVQIHNALAYLSNVGTVAAVSHLYETKAQYVTDQPNFLNAVCALDTMLEPHVLLSALKEIEIQMGRVPTIRYGERCIDLDILLYESVVINDATLAIPHAKMSERAFVLVPLADIAAHVYMPGQALSVVELLTQLPLSEREACVQVIE
jgi:2-amino-4-hydroxy-6-hydroxymethyldihydropteridine diphosphokinase